MAAHDEDMPSTRSSNDLLENIDIEDVFADIVLQNAETNRTGRLYSNEAASLIARLDWSDAALADRVESALILGTECTTTTRDGVWTITVDTNARVRVTNIAGPISLGAAALTTRLLDLHTEFFQ